MKKICIVTSGRSDYGLLHLLMLGIKKSTALQLQIIATGMHLSPEFGLTYKLIELDGFKINRKVEILLSSDTGVGVAKSMGLGLVGFADAFEDLKPDMVILLGDRYEILAAASAALVQQIPIGHIHGGEVTSGAFDDAIRHSITKMSLFHFVAAQEYQRRVIQLGENPKNIFLVGGLGVDAIKNTNLYSKDELENILEFQFGKKNLIITYHPETVEDKLTNNDINCLLFALETFPDIKLIFTMPNSDNGSRKIMKRVIDFVEVNKGRATYFKSMGHLNYLSSLQYVDGVVGNSSSALMEVPTFKKGSINIGSRQSGRLMASSIINCSMNTIEIEKAIRKLYSEDFKTELLSTKNPYGEGDASEKIIKILELNDKNLSFGKEFYDVSFKQEG